MPARSRLSSGTCKSLKPQTISGHILSLGAALCLVMVLPALAGDQKLGEPEVWGEETKVVPFDRFYIAGEPDEAALQRARENGVTMVISLQGDGELQGDEEAAAEALGLDYHRFAVNGAAPALDSAPLERATAAVQSDLDAKIFVHCASGNRASAWLAVYLAETTGMSPDQAIAIARETGLREGLEAKVRTYLAQ